VHPVMPWFFPFATLIAWLGVRSARDLRSEGRAAWGNAIWLLILTTFPLFIWLIIQYTSRLGAFQ